MTTSLELKELHSQISDITNNLSSLDERIENLPTSGSNTEALESKIDGVEEEIQELRTEAADVKQNNENVMETVEQQTEKMTALTNLVNSFDQKIDDNKTISENAITKATENKNNIDKIESRISEYSSMRVVDTLQRLQSLQDVKNNEIVYVISKNVIMRACVSKDQTVSWKENHFNGYGFNAIGTKDGGTPLYAVGYSGLVTSADNSAYVLSSIDSKDRILVEYHGNAQLLETENDVISQSIPSKCIVGILHYLNEEGNPIEEVETWKTNVASWHELKEQENAMIAAWKECLRNWKSAAWQQSYSELEAQKVTKLNEKDALSPDELSEEEYNVERERLDKEIEAIENSIEEIGTPTKAPSKPGSIAGDPPDYPSEKYWVATRQTRNFTDAEIANINKTNWDSNVPGLTQKYFVTEENLDAIEIEYDENGYVTYFLQDSDIDDKIVLAMVDFKDEKDSDGLKKAKENENKISAIQGVLVEQATTNGQNTTKFGEIDGTLSNITSTLETISGTLKTLSDDLASLTDRVKALEDNNAETTDPDQPKPDPGEQTPAEPEP